MFFGGKLRKAAFEIVSSPGALRFGRYFMIVSMKPRKMKKLFEIVDSCMVLMLAVISGRSRTGFWLKLFS